jgi:hypothetical protein
LTGRCTAFAVRRLSDFSSGEKPTEDTDPFTYKQVLEKSP